MSVVLGVDQSLRHTGIVILNRQLVIVQKATFEPKTDGVVRMSQIVDNLLSLAAIHGVGAIAMEGVAHGSKWGVADAGGLYWLIRMAFHKVNRPVLTVAPSTLKKWITGKGKGDKNEIMRSAARKWPQTSKLNEHEVDAFGLASIGQAFYYGQKSKEDRTMAEKEVLLTLMKSHGGF